MFPFDTPRKKNNPGPSCCAAKQKVGERIPKLYPTPGVRMAPSRSAQFALIEAWVVASQ